MKAFCPSCQKESIVTRLRRVEEFEVKGEQIPVDVDSFQCLECGAQFNDPDPANDPRTKAFREYRARWGMVQPEQIRTFRKSYDLSQSELSQLIGFGGATLSRYENGALQDESHDRLLRLIMLPANLLKIIEEDQRALAAEKRESLIARLRAEITRIEFIALINQKGRYGGPNLSNGLVNIDLSRLAAAIKMLCYQANVYQSKLGKLLFYADFKHFKEYGAGITGLCYANLPQGPAPDRFDIILQCLFDFDPALTIQDDPSLDAGGQYVRCEVEPQHTGFSFAELQVLMQVDSFFKSFTSARIRHFSSEEDACLKTKTGELISYEYARRLRI